MSERIHFRAGFMTTPVARPAKEYDVVRSPSYSRHVAELRERRRQVLLNPRLLMGEPEPPIDGLWAYTIGLTEAIDVLLDRAPESWSQFLREDRRFGARTEYRILHDKRGPFADQAAFLLELYDAYDGWAAAREQEMVGK